MKKTEKLYREILCVIKANHIKACYPQLKAEKNRVNLWELDMSRQYNSDKMGSYNLGDYLARVVVEFMLKGKGLSLESEVSHTKFLNSIGSNLGMSYQNATIWGSGFEKELPWMKNILQRRPLRKLDVRAVRGPLTYAYLKKLNQIPPP